MSARFSDLKVGIRELSFPFMQELTEKQLLQENSKHVIMCSHVVVNSVVVIDLRYDILNYNYLWLKPQLLLITITQILRQ